MATRTTGAPGLLRHPAINTRDVRKMETEVALASMAGGAIIDYVVEVLRHIPARATASSRDRVPARHTAGDPDLRFDLD